MVTRKKPQAWVNPQTGESVVLPEGTSPLDNPNSLVAQPEEEFEEVPETAEDRVSSMLSDFGGTGSIHIYKRDDHGTLGFATKMPVEEFDTGWLEMVRARFGAGDFEIRLYAPNPATNKTSIRGRQVVRILPDASPKTNPVPQESPQLMALLEKMNARIDAMERPQVDPQAQFMQQLSMLKMMREVFDSGPKTDPLEGMQKIIALVSGARELREVIDPNPEPKDPLTAIMPEALATVRSILENQNRNFQPQPQEQWQQPMLPSVELAPTMQPQPQAQPTAQLMPNPAPEEPMGQLTPEEQVRAEFREIVRTLNSLAAINMSPETVADGILERATDEQIDFLADEHWWEGLQSFDASVTPYKDWYEKVRAAVVAQLDADSDNAALPPA